MTSKCHTDLEPADVAQPFCRLKSMLLAALIGLTFLAYAGVADCDFVSLDDPFYVTENDQVLGGITFDNTIWAFSTFHADNWHPLTWLSLQLDAELFGSRPQGYHFTNLVLHVANVVLVFLIFHRMTMALWRSAIVAALFAVHPLHVESVAWVSERKDVLCAFFALLCIAAYCWYARRPGLVRFVPVAVAMALALLAKPMAVTVPCVLALLDFWPLGRWNRSSWPLLIAEKLPLLLLAGCDTLLTLGAQPVGSVRLARPYRIMNALVSYPTYLGKTLWPTNLAVYYTYPGTDIAVWQAGSATALLLAITTLCLLLRRRNTSLIVGWLWFLGTLVPVIGLVQVGVQARADRYMYLPSIGLIFALVWAAPNIRTLGRSVKLVYISVAGLVLTALVIVTQLQVRNWRDSLALWQRAVAVNPDSAFAHDALATNYAAAGNYDEALVNYEQALENSPPTARNRYRAHYVRLLQKLGRVKEAQAQLKLLTEER